jgi:hypothetical protein
MDLAHCSTENASGVHPRALDVSISAGSTIVHGTLNVPVGTRGLVVLFGSDGSSRFDPGPRFTAQVLEQAGLATLTLDPMQPCSETEVIGVLAWLSRQSFTASLPVGLLSRRDCARAVAGAAVLLGLPNVLMTEAEPLQKAAELAAELFLSRLTRG